VVHLWVEGFFEVFATAALALIFARMGLVNRQHAGAAVIASRGWLAINGSSRKARCSASLFIARRSG